MKNVSNSLHTSHLAKTAFLSLPPDAEMEQTVVDFNSRQLNIKRCRTRRPFASFEDLPPEILQLILDYCGMLDYHKYRLLRCSPQWKPLIDKQYIVLSQKGSKFLLPGADLRSARSFFNKCQEFTTMLKEFSYKNKIPLSKVKLFTEFNDTQRFHDHTRSPSSLLVPYLTKLGVTYVIYPRNSHWAQHLEPFEFGHNSVVLIDCSYGELTDDHRELLRYINFRVFDIGSTLELFAGDDHLHCLLEPDSYVFRSKLAHLKTLKTFELKKLPLSLGNSIVMNSLESLEIWHWKTKKVVSITRLNLPRLISLKIIDCKLLRFLSNNLPSLIDLEIEESPKRHELLLELNHNKLYSLQNLSISTNFVRQIFGNELPCNNETSATQLQHSMVRFRLDTSLEKLTGTLGDIPDLLSHARDVAIIVRNDPTMTQSLLRNIYNTSRMRKLTLIDQTLITLDCLSEISFQNLREFFLYDTNDFLISLPILKMPKMERLFIIESRINTVNIREYPALEEIYFQGGERNTGEIIRYFHFACQGSYPHLFPRGRVETEVRFEYKGFVDLGKWKTLITTKTREIGVLKLDCCEVLKPV